MSNRSRSQSELYRGELNAMPPGVQPKNAPATTDWAIGQPSAVKTLISGDTSITAGIQCQFQKPGTFTASFALKPLSAVLLTQAPLRAEAIINWSVAGNNIRRRISIVDGTSIQGVAEGVSIQVIDVTAVGPAPAITLGIPYMVAVSIAPGNRASYDNPPILNTQNVINTILTTASLTLAVPEDAGIKSVYVPVFNSTAGNVLADQEVIVRMASGGGTIMAAYDARAINWAPLMPGTQFLTILNRSADSIGAAVIWGIDG